MFSIYHIYIIILLLRNIFYFLDNTFYEFIDEFIFYITISRVFSLKHIFFFKFDILLDRSEFSSEQCNIWWMNVMLVDQKWLLKN
jgi:hypothetical protein